MRLFSSGAVWRADSLCAALLQRHATPCNRWSLPQPESRGILHPHTWLEGKHDTTGDDLLFVLNRTAVGCTLALLLHCTVSVTFPL